MNLQKLYRLFPTPSRCQKTILTPVSESSQRELDDAYFKYFLPRVSIFSVFADTSPAK